MARYPLSDEQIAFLNYQARLKQDEDARNQLAAYAQIQIDDSLAQELRDGFAGKLTDKELYDLVGHRIDHFARIGNTDVKRGTDEWRSLARKLCQSEYEALERMFELDEGISDGEIETPFLKAAANAVHTTPPLSLSNLFEDYVASRQQIGFQRDGGRRQRPVSKSIVAFLKHDDARRVTRSNIREWRDELMKTMSAKTVSDIHLSAVKSLLDWAVENDMLPENVAKHVRQQKQKVIRQR